MGGTGRVCRIDLRRRCRGLIVTEWSPPIVLGGGSIYEYATIQVFLRRSGIFSCYAHTSNEWRKRTTGI